MLLYIKDAAASSSSHGTLQIGGTAPATSTTGTGFRVGNTAGGNYCLQVYNTQSVTGFGATVLPNAAPTTNDCWRSDGALSGSFSSGTWNIAVAVIAVSNGSSGSGRLRFRVWRSTNPTGTSAVEITSGTITTNNWSNVTTSTQQTLSATFNPGSFSLNGEYLFLQIACEIISGSTSASSNVSIRQDEIFSAITTPAFIYEINGTDTPAVTDATISSSAWGIERADAFVATDHTHFEHTRILTDTAQLSELHTSEVSYSRTLNDSAVSTDLAQAFKERAGQDTLDITDSPIQFDYSKGFNEELDTSDSIGFGFSRPCFETEPFIFTDEAEYQLFLYSEFFQVETDVDEFSTSDTAFTEAKRPGTEYIFWFDEPPVLESVVNLTHYKITPLLTSIGGEDRYGVPVAVYSAIPTVSVMTTGTDASITGPHTMVLPGLTLTSDAVGQYLFLSSALNRVDFVRIVNVLGPTTVEVDKLLVTSDPASVGAIPYQRTTPILAAVLRISEPTNLHLYEISARPQLHSGKWVDVTRIHQAETESPRLINAELLSGGQVLITFSEPVLSESHLYDANAYDFDADIIVTAVYATEDPKRIILDTVGMRVPEEGYILQVNDPRTTTRFVQDKTVITDVAIPQVNLVAIERSGSDSITTNDEAAADSKEINRPINETLDITDSLTLFPAIYTYITQDVASTVDKLYRDYFKHFADVISGTSDSVDVQPLMRSGNDTLATTDKVSFDRDLIRADTSTVTDAVGLTRDKLITGDTASTSDSATTDLTLGNIPSIIATNTTIVDTGGSDSITIYGVHLGTATGVTLGGTSCTITETAAERLTVTTPSKTAGNHSLQVTTPTGTASTTIEVWAPSQITGIDGYLDSQKGRAGASGVLSSWTEQSRSAQYSAAGGSNSPGYANNIFHNKIGITFIKPGVTNDAQWVGTGSLKRTLPNGSTILWYSRHISTDNVAAEPSAANPPLTVVGDVTGGSYQNIGFSGGNIVSAHYNGTSWVNRTRGTAYNDNQARLFGKTHTTSATIKFWVNGVQEGSSHTSDGNYNTSFYGWAVVGGGYKDNTNAFDGFDGYIAGVFIINGIISTTDMDKLNRWCQAHFGGPDPSLFPTTGWWRAFTGTSPWSGTASAGVSGSNNLSEATNPPSATTTLFGLKTAVFDGINDVLTGAAISTFFNTSAYFIGMLLYVEQTSTGGVGEGEILSDSVGVISVGTYTDGNGKPRIFNEKYNGTTWQRGEIGLPLNQWCFVQIVLNASFHLIRVDDGPWGVGSVNGGLTSSQTGDLRIGASKASFSKFFKGKIAEIILTDGSSIGGSTGFASNTSTTQDKSLVALRTYLTYRYGLFDINSLVSITGWWTSNRYFGAGFWEGNPSGGSSWERNTSEGSNYPNTITPSPPVNGYDLVNFDGTNDRLSTGFALSSFIATNAWTVWAIINVDTTAVAANPWQGGAVISDSHTNGTFWTGIGVRNNGGAKVYTYQWDGSSKIAETTITPGALTLVQARLSGGVLSIRVNGGAWTNTSGVGNVTTITGIVGLGTNNQSTVFFDGKVLDVGLANTAFSDTILDQMKLYFNAKFNQSW